MESAMPYEMKKLGCDPGKLKGLSEKLIVSHYENNYGGAVKRLNSICDQLAGLDPAAAPLGLQLEDLPNLSRFRLPDLRCGWRRSYEVAANWKLVCENYSECYHCPGIHPQLNKLTPYDLGGDYAPEGPWQGGWMELVDGAETMARI